MEVSQFLYFGLVNFNSMLCTLGPSILFYYQFTDSLHHCVTNVGFEFYTKPQLGIALHQTPRDR